MGDGGIGSYGRKKERGRKAPGRHGVHWIVRGREEGGKGWGAEGKGGGKQRQRKPHETFLVGVPSERKSITPSSFVWRFPKRPNILEGKYSVKEREREKEGKPP